MDPMTTIKACVEAAPVVVFMKGTPQQPRSRECFDTVRALQRCGAVFHHVNVLEDPVIRAFLPKFSTWSGFPQVFIFGELIGGWEVIRDLAEQGQLGQMMQELSPTRVAV